MYHPHPGEFGAKIAIVVVALLASLPFAKADSLTLKPERKIRDRVSLVDREMYVHLQVNESTYFNFYSDKTEDILNCYGPHLITEDSRNRVHVVRKAKNAIKLRLNKQGKEDNGQVYKFTAQNKNTNQETASYLLHITVYSNYTTMSGKVDYTAREGDELRMECTVTSDPTVPFVMKWKKEGIELSHLSPTHRIVTSSPVCVFNCDEVRTTVSQMTIFNVRKEDAGEYTCAFNTTQLFMDAGKEHKMKLQVEHKPFILTETPNEILWVDKKAIVHSDEPIRVNINVSIVANPVATLTWFQVDAHQVSPSSGKLTDGIYPSSMGCMMIKIDSSKPNYSQLSLLFNLTEIRNESLSGKEKTTVKFTLLAENQLGSSMKEYEVKLGGPPFPPEILSIDFKNGMNILQLNESQVEKSQPKAAFYRLEVGTVEPFLVYYLKKNSSNNGSYPLDSAIPLGSHQMKIFANNTFGWSINSSNTYSTSNLLKDSLLYIAGALVILLVVVLFVYVSRQKVAPVRRINSLGHQPSSMAISFQNIPESIDNSLRETAALS